MKKALTLVVLIVTARMAFAQGMVTFNNNSTYPVKQWTSTSDSTLISVPKSVGTTASGRVQLLAYYNSTSASLTPFFTMTPAGYPVLTYYTSLSAYLAANPGWVAYSTVAISSLQNGVFSGGVVTIGTDDGPLGASPDGASASYAVLGWTGSYTTFDQAFTAMLIGPAMSFVGISSVFTTATGNPYSTPPGTATTLAATFTGETLAPLGIPEPTTFALVSLGAAALMIARRRR